MDTTRIRVSEEILARYPGFRLRALYALGLRNGPSDARSREWLRAAAAQGLAALGGRRPGEHPHLRLWRDAYSAFGAKPSAYPCSAESLIQRVVKGGADAVPGINCQGPTAPAHDLAVGLSSDSITARYFNSQGSPYFVKIPSIVLK